MTHLGSAKDLGLQKTLQQTIQGISKILEDYQGKTKLLIEIAAGAGKIIGDSFDDVAYILKNVPKDVGVCFDTAHAFASGYDLRDNQTTKKTIAEFDKSIGLKKLKLLHGNDSKSDLASHVDRHEHLGQGKIGLACFQTIIQDPRLKNLNLILETPSGKAGQRDKRMEDIKILKNMRENW